ncbi:glycoside hydrolase family 17 protein [Pseudohyphozyma bogoriensis]|nr:glycoside hydrolase family 17 protein [Pseudohyphozyma bogoriensis]
MSRYGTGYHDHPLPTTPSYQHQQPSYPPYADHGYSGSAFSLHRDGTPGAFEDDDDTPLSPSQGYGTSGGGFEKVQREKNNPFVDNYKGEGKSKKWMIVIAIALVIVGAGIGIGVWRALSNKSSSGSSSTGNSTTTNSGTSLQYIDGTARVVKSNPQDPSDFEKDSRHVHGFGARASPNLANVTEDIQLLSQLTTRLRMYGGACNQTQLTLQAIQDTKVNMTVWLGVYIGTNETVNTQQMDYALEAIQIYGTDHISGVTVGNEYILDEGTTAATLATAITYITDKVSSFKTQLDALNLSVTLPVGTADAGSSFSVTLAEGVDQFFANVHPYFGGVPIDQSAGTNKPDTFIAETGWPSGAMAGSNGTDGASVAGVSELQTYLDTFVCQANVNKTAYFYFEPFDEPWKEEYGGVEPYWGLMDYNKVLKDLTLPNCTVGF